MSRCQGKKVLTFEMGISLNATTMAILDGLREGGHRMVLRGLADGKIGVYEAYGYWGDPEFPQT